MPLRISGRPAADQDPVGPEPPNPPLEVPALIRTMRLIWAVFSIGTLAMATPRRTRADDAAEASTPVIPTTMNDAATEILTVPVEDPFPYRQPEIRAYSFRASVGVVDEFGVVGQENHISLSGSKAFIARASRAILDSLEREAA